MMTSGGHEAPVPEGNSCIGSENTVVYAAVNLVRDNCIPEVKGYSCFCYAAYVLYRSCICLCGSDGSFCATVK